MLNASGMKTVGLIIGNKDKRISSEHYIYLGDSLTVSQLNKFYNVADVTVFPSKGETFGKVVAESISSGTPVVAFDGSGSDDIIIDGFNGCFAENGSLTALFDSVMRAFSLPRPKSAFHEDIIARFSPKSAALKYLELKDKMTTESKKNHET